MSRRKIPLTQLLALLAAATSPISAHALFGIDSPWCMGDGGGTFLCVRGVGADSKLSHRAD